MAINNNNNRPTVRRSTRTYQAVNRLTMRQVRLFQVLRDIILVNPSLPLSLDNIRTLDTIFEENLSLQMIFAYLSCYFYLLRHINNDEIEDLLESDDFAEYSYDSNEPDNLIEHIKTYTCIMASSYGRIDVLEECKRQNFNLNNEKILYCACANLYVDVVDWCIRNNCPYNIEKCLQQVRNHEDSVADCNGISVGDRIEQLLRSR